MHIHEGLEQRWPEYRIGAKVERVQAFVDWLKSEGSISLLHPPLVGGLGSCKSRRCYYTHPLRRNQDSTLSLHCYLTAFSLFLPSFIYLSSLITETCSRASIVARLRSQNGLGQNNFSCVKKARSSFLFCWDPYLHPIAYRIAFLQPLKVSLIEYLIYSMGWRLKGMHLF